ncbi:MAG TPA: UDP-2,3-diacylglucosamine diphosphatase [Steroidobacteraceae bacterium]|nr:UDP-2,3-diacylglucosamine diphosphatase [Steroidobacteraceae bacterium]
MSTLLVSDVHLDGTLPEAIAQFETFLSGPARAAEALYILGDLFESWVGDDDDDPDRARVCAALRALSRAGVACHVCHGNRDFLMATGFEDRTGCRILADPSIVERYGERVLLTHGDALCIDDTAYQHLRSVVRSAAWQHRFMRLPLDTRRLLADAARAGSRNHTGMMAAAIMDVNPTAIVNVLRACQVRTMIHGHTHRPAFHDMTIDGAPARRLVLGAWYEHGSYLRWDERGFTSVAVADAAAA